MTMIKNRLTRILAKADGQVIASLSADVQKAHSPVIVKAPSNALAMIKMRDPVKQGLFYIGEVIVCEATVEIDGVKGVAVIMNENAGKALDIAIIDAAINKGVFDGWNTLLWLEKEQNDMLMRENAMHMKTMVNFESLDMEAPNDLNAYKKA